MHRAAMTRPAMPTVSFSWPRSLPCLIFTSWCCSASGGTRFRARTTPPYRLFGMVHAVSVRHAALLQVFLEDRVGRLLLLVGKALIERIEDRHELGDRVRVRGGQTSVPVKLIVRRVGRTRSRLLRALLEQSVHRFC